MSKTSKKALPDEWKANAFASSAWEAKALAPLRSSWFAFSLLPLPSLLTPLSESQRRGKTESLQDRVDPRQSGVCQYLMRDLVHTPFLRFRSEHDASRTVQDRAETNQVDHLMSQNVNQEWIEGSQSLPFCGPENAGIV